MNQITVYGADWCEDTQATLNHLDALGAQFEYVNVDRDPAAEQWVKDHNFGKRKTPTLDINGEILVEPDEMTLSEFLRDRHLMS